MYGFNINRHSLDYFFKYRVILGSSRGTLLELGLTPLITASSTLHLLAVSSKFSNSRQFSDTLEVKRWSTKLERTVNLHISYWYP